MTEPTLQERLRAALREWDESPNQGDMRLSKPLVREAAARIVELEREAFST